MELQRSCGCCLTIAGSDSGGNAGVQADLRVFHDYRLHGCTVFAALTAQNPFGVAAIHELPSSFVGEQLRAVLGTYDIKAMKTGMLANAETIERVAQELRGYGAIKKVIDPVMVATSGARLISEAAIETLKRELLPIATIITPNLPEARALCGKESGEARELAEELSQRFGTAVLVKGGHSQGASAVDVLYDGNEAHEFALEWIGKPISTHGTGCSLAAAITAELAQGRALAEAIAGAKNYVHRAIANSYYVGKDCGVLGWGGEREG